MPIPATLAPQMPTPLPQRLSRALALLEATYGPRPPPSRGMDEVGALIATILSQSTTDRNAARGYRALRNAFPTWDAVADAPVPHIERSIRAAGLSRQKAPRIRSILRHLRDNHRRISLRFLRKLTPDAAMEYLTAFPGVGPKTAACVLLFACRMPLFPVDTHVHRIALRNGWIPPRTPATRAQQILQAALNPQQRFPLHVLLLDHGKQTCRPRNPACHRCCLRQHCNHARSTPQAPQKA